MSNINEEIRKRLYPTFRFIEEDISKFEEIACLNNAEDLVDAQDNVYNYIAKKIKKDGLIKIFGAATKVMRIKDVFDTFNSIINYTNIDISDDDILELSNKKTYQDLYNQIIRKRKNEDEELNIKNDLLKKVVEAKLALSEDVQIEEINLSDYESFTDDILKDYLIYIGRFEILSREEEIELFKKYHQGDEEAKEKIVNHNLRLVVSVAKKNRPLDMKMDFMDYVQEGNIGLLAAVDKFDETRGNKFSTMASWWIKQKLNRSVDDFDSTIRIPVHTCEEIRKFRKARWRLENETSEEVTDEDIRQELGWDEKKYNRIKKIITQMNLVYLDRTIDGGGKKDRDSTVGSFIADTTIEPVAEQAEFSMFREQGEKIMKKVLTEKEILIIKDRFGWNTGGEKLTLEEVGKKIGVTRERIRQIEARAIRKLNAYGETAKQEKIKTRISKSDIERKEEIIMTKTVYELVGVSKKEGDKLIKNLSEEEQRIIAKKNNGEELTKEEKMKYYNAVNKLRKWNTNENLLPNKIIKKGKFKAKKQTKKYVKKEQKAKTSKRKEPRSIYTLINADRETIDRIITTLSPEHQALIIKRASGEAITQQEQYRFFYILKAIKAKIAKEANPSKKTKKQSTPNIVSQLDEQVENEIQMEAKVEEPQKTSPLLAGFDELVENEIQSMGETPEANIKEEIVSKEEVQLPVEKEENNFAAHYRSLLSIAIKDPAITHTVKMRDIAITCVRYGIGECNQSRDSETIAKFFGVSSEYVEQISNTVLEMLYNVIVKSMENQDTPKTFLKETNKN